jgi:ABC-2 type transport system ATP-binding protein
VSAQEEVVRVEGLVKEFRSNWRFRRIRVLDGISFSVRRGEIFGFVGPNGAGKTTTLKVLMGLIRPSGGSAEILGHDVRTSEFHRHVGFLPENPWFHDFLTGAEILRFYAQLSGVPRAQIAERAQALLQQVGLAHAADVRLRAYSKGMLQRIGIAQALVHDPEVVFLDEPMSGLDPIGRKEIRDLILRLRNEGRTVFMNTHILTDVEALCDRVAIIAKGRIRYAGRIEDFLEDHERCSDLVMAGVAPDLIERFEEGLEAQVRGSGDRIEVRLQEKDVAEALRMVLDSGGKVVSLAPHRVSLESVFLTAVHESAQSAPGEGDA